MEEIKEAFVRVKEDISSLQREFNNLRKSLINLNYRISYIENNLTSLKFQQNSRQTIQQVNPTQPTHTPTHNFPLRGLKTENFDLSMRNEGVPTDRQTDQQTDQQTDNSSKNKERPSSFRQKENFSNKKSILMESRPYFQSLQTNLQTTSSQTNNPIYPPSTANLKDTAEILSQLDSIKKDLRLRFKRLTPQEMLIFSTLYQFQEEGIESTYNSISSKLNLSESSIRDYVQRIIKKGIIIDKKKINNKQILLKISENITRLASLSTIIQLREI